MRHVSVVGLGAMGSRIARRLLGAGYPVTVWNRSPGKDSLLASLGANVAATPAEAAARADMLITMVADPGSLRAVTEGSRGIAAGSHDSLTIIEMSTVGPAAITELSSALPAGTGLIDAPVLGSIRAAENGSLIILAGGTAPLPGPAMTMLSTLGSVIHTGPLGTGAAAKLVANSAQFSVLGTLGETVALGRALGLSANAVNEVLAVTPLADQAARRRQAIETGDYPARFALALARKDADLISQAAKAVGAELRLAAAARTWLADAEAAGRGGQDYTAMLAAILSTRDRGTGAPAHDHRQRGLRLGSHTREIQFDLYDSFAGRRFGGNVAGVVICDNALPVAVMQDIACELGAPTTGFAEAGAGQPVSIRFFTPRREIDACGHVTLAVTTALVERGIWQAGDGQFQAITPAGTLPILARAADGLTLVGLTYHPRPVGPAGAAREDIEAALSVPTDPGLPIEVIWTGLRHLVVPVDGLQALAGLAPSEPALTSLATACGADAICVFTRLGDRRARMRDFCAPIGSLEEPASGTTSAALAAYITRHVAASKPSSITVEQGVEMGRPSQIEVDVAFHGEQARATVWGSALKTASGTIFPS
jgi:3-hydroxyisobutyrate dehydrogenase